MYELTMTSLCKYPTVLAVRWSILGQGGSILGQMGYGGGWGLRWLIGRNGRYAD
jgi:hypothetical protein